jgi:hypothetical protein
MAWTFDYDALAGKREYLLRRVKRDGASGIDLELAGRIHRWLELPTAAATLFARAAVDAEQFLSDFPLPIARHGALLYLAGDERGARESLERARSLFSSTPYRADEVAVSYLLGEDDEALRIGAPDYPGTVLAAARRNRDPGPLEGLAMSYAKEIRARRVELSVTQIRSVLSDYDWLEECFLLEASLQGVPVPSHRAMLDRVGLIAKGKHREAVEPELPMGRWEIGDTALVAPAVGRVKITLDRPRRLVLEIEGEAPAYGVALYEDDAMLGAASPVANYTEAAVDILHAYAPEHEGAFLALLAAARA